VKGANATLPPGGVPGNAYGGRRSKYEIYDLEEPRGRGRSGRTGNGSIMRDAVDYDVEELSDQESGDEEMDITYRSPVVPNGPNSATPLVKQSAKKNHRHTASIASLIRAEDRAEDGWSPIAGSFTFPPVNGRGDEARSPVARSPRP